MVSVCGGCDAYYPWAALFLGGIAGALHLLASIILVKMKIDDPLDAAPIHFVCGKMICVSQTIVFHGIGNLIKPCRLFSGRKRVFHMNLIFRSLGFDSISHPSP